MAAQILAEIYSDYVLSALYLSDIISEEISHTFPYPEGFNSMTLTEKAEQFVMSYFLKLLTIVNFGNMSFIDVASFSPLVKGKLNEGSRLDVNQPGLLGPDLTSVREEIQNIMKINNLKIWISLNFWAL